MPVTPGTRLGPYEIITPIGVGGMGEVYRARDAKLQRDVALKILPEAFASDPDRVARFEREARVLAGLNHPHIAAIYGFHEAEGVNALAMELVDGSTLAERIERGAVPLDEALPLARQIADALDAAHERGIVHRDLKPANIKIREDGTVKVLDFGLAKALDPMEREGSADRRSVSLSPTLTAPTQLGVILGTAAYMSPEQARGKPVDKRADIWAFGVVLYEMLTGSRAFHAEEISDTLAFVLTKEPDRSALPPGTPPAIHKLLSRCLEKDRKRRLADIADARFEIEEALRHDAVAPSIAAAPTRRSGVVLPWALATAAILVAVAAILMWAPWHTTAARAPLRLSADFGTSFFVGGPGQSIEISPTGDTIAFIGQGSNGPELHLRRLNQLTSARVEGTVGANSPFFSPDGQWVAFFADGKLKKVSVNGGASITLSDEPGPRGGAWGEDGSIVFMHSMVGGSPAADGAVLYRVSASGGTAGPLTKVSEGEVTHRWPQLLNGGRTVLFTAGPNTGGYEDAHIVVQQVPDGPRKTVVTGGYHGRYVSTGHVLYMHAGTLFAVPFDLARFEVTGPAVPAVEGVGANPGTAAAHFSVSDEGTLVYIPGEAVANNAPIVWIDRQSRVEPLRAAPANWTNVQFAPDGRRLALDIRAPQARIWTYEWDRDTATQITFGPGDDTNPIWSPDGRYIAYASRSAGSPALNIFVRRADGSGEAVRLTDNRTDPELPTSWHPSGKFIAFTVVRPGTGQDLMILPLEGDANSGWKPGKPFAFLATRTAEFDGVFSPDGRWIAYNSAESGVPDVYVRPFPNGDGKWKLSTETGARTPTWSRAGHEVLYRTAASNRLMAVAYSADGNTFRAEKPVLWAEGTFGRPNGQRGFDIHPDGRRVAAVGGRQPETLSRQDRAVFVFNFFDELRRIAPPSKQ